MSHSAYFRVLFDSLEFGVYLGDTQKLDGVQRRWSKEVVGMESLKYLKRFRELCLFSCLWKNIENGPHLSMEYFPCRCRYRPGLNNCEK